MEKLLELEPKGKFVFVGDTHGDLEASEIVINKYLNVETKICFLGDYVDRGEKSKENVEYLLKIKKENPEKIILLQGNHENYPIQNFNNDNFWESLSSDETEEYYNIFREFPMVLSVGNVIALHGALPQIKNLKEINDIKEKDENWRAILGGDFFPKFIDCGEDSIDDSDSYLRPAYKQNYFESIMDNINKRILIRSHQPDAEKILFDKRCLTIFTSSAYGTERTIAMVDFGKKMDTIEDLVIQKID